MRNVVAFVLVLVASPLTAGAQEGGEGTLPPDVADPSQETQPTQSWLHRMHPGAFVDPLSGNVVPESTSSDFELQYLPGEEPEPELTRDEKKVRNAKIGMGVSGAAAFAGGVMVIVGADLPVIDFSAGSSSDSGRDALLFAGTAVAAAGGVSLIATGILLRVRKRRLRDSKATTHRKVQWDLARSRLVF